ncbi:hypothetical protein [Escherichia coli]|uniref:hypothetical protein n=1 Tax=Escherichia coli TaxID=562 RepID=UPI0032B44287
MPDAQVSTVIKKCGFWDTINYTDHCTRGYNVEQAGTRKIAIYLKIKNIMNNVAHYETAKNTNL